MGILTQLDESLFLFDLLEQGQAGRSSAYILKGRENVLVETGSSLSHQRILTALQEAEIALEELHYCIVTHVHLDHAGGAGTLARVCPNTIFIAQERAARHLIDPSRLLQGAHSVYGDATETYFGEVLPVPANQVLVKKHGETLQLPDRELAFYDTPGHAKHHFSIHDPARKSIYSGDALGIRYVRSFTGWNFEFILPSTSPTDFDPVGVAKTVALLSTLGADTVYHTHFGPSPANEAFASTLQGALEFAELVETLYEPTLTWEELAMSLQGYIGATIHSMGHNEPLAMEDIGIDIELDAKGLQYYAEQKWKASRSSVE